MTTETHVVELTSEAQWRAIHPVMSQLRPLDVETFLDHVRVMAGEGYRLFGLYEGSGDDGGDGGGERVDVADPVALAGVRLSTTLYHGRHAWVYDLVTREDRRSEGHGAELLAFVEEWARDHDCAVVELASGLWRDDAHRFYEEHVDYERYCYTFKKDLAEGGE
ncbi:GNAT family N-acetyltransferase [Salinigranum rubrum]|uniref:GNAT family N-acetyltransferase n=1 Tax=Salinigranum rubrum TaxID=755307 RepID=A0A2I8VJ22_9EURY|nr:GNAT family N-acetyltransferase [Salinigranum rubrum]AUV81937.1 GNAT family N-acetyltransferase [Salinigranum rubrum]